MSNYFKGANKLSVGDEFTVKIKGWNCQTQMPDTSIIRLRSMWAKRDTGPGVAASLNGGMYLQDRS
jgi:hypothetical protein